MKLSERVGELRRDDRLGEEPVTIENQTRSLDALSDQHHLLRKAKWRAIAFVLAGFVPMFLILQYGPGLLLERLAQPWPVVIPAAIMLALAAGFEILFFKKNLLVALRQLGYGSSRVRAIIVALIISGIMLIFFPILSIITGARLSLNSGWLPTLVGIIVFNGFAEETLFRGYVFGNLQQENSFLRAGFISLILFAAVHLLLFVGNPPIIAIAGTLVAVTAAFPMAYLFERSGNTIWAPLILHIATHTIRLVDIPEPQYMQALIAWLVMQIFLPLLIFLFRNYIKV